MHKHTLQSLSPLPPHPGVWLLLFKVSFDTVELCNFGSDCFEKCFVRKSCKTCYLGPLPLGSGAAFELRPLLSALAWAALKICLCLAVSFANPLIALLTWLPGLASDLFHRYGPVSSLRNCVISYCCHSASSGISESWSIMDSHTLQFLPSTPYVLHSENTRAALTVSTRPHLY